MTSSTVISGLRVVMQTSIGIVPPPGAVYPSRSLNTLNLAVSRQVRMYLITLLCLHVYLPWSRETEQLASTWQVVSLPLHCFQ